MYTCKYDYMCIYKYMYIYVCVFTCVCKICSWHVDSICAHDLGYIKYFGVDFVCSSLGMVWHIVYVFVIEFSYFVENAQRLHSGAT